MIAYQLYSPERDWYGYYIWSSKELALEMCEQMNNDIKKLNEEWHYELREVEIV